MTTVYVLTEGEYSDYHIIGVYSTQANAEWAVGWVGGNAEIEEYALDAGLDEINAGLDLYSVCLHWDGTLCEMELAADYERGDLNDVGLKPRRVGTCGTVFARDKQHAIKIANEKRAQFIAMNLVPE